MDNNFLEQFDFIYQIYEKRVKALGAIPSVLGFSKYLGHKNDGKPKQWKKGQRPSTNDCAVLHEKFGLRVQWLTTGKGEPYEARPKESLGPPTMRRTGEYSPVEYVRGPHIAEVPVWGIAEAGRMGVEIFELAPSRFIPILQRYYREKLIAFEVEGRSMEPTIRHGSVIGVVPFDGTFDSGAMYLVKRPHFGLLVKRVYMGKNMLILKSDNPEHPPLELPYEGYEQDTVVLGRVIWIWQDA